MRAHLLLDKCLNKKNSSSILKNDPDFRYLLEEAEAVYSDMLTGKKSYEELKELDALQTAQRKIRIKRDRLSQSSKTSNLWIKHRIC